MLYFTFSQLAEKLCKHKSVSCVTLPQGLVQARAIGTSCVAKTTMGPVRALPAGPGALRAHGELSSPLLPPGTKSLWHRLGVSSVCTNLF